MILIATTHHVLQDRYRKILRDKVKIKILIIINLTVNTYSIKKSDFLARVNSRRTRDGRDHESSIRLVLESR